MKVEVITDPASVARMISMMEKTVVELEIQIYDKQLTIQKYHKLIKASESNGVYIQGMDMTIDQGIIHHQHYAYEHRK